jgi:cyclic pyranopterin phosphate synthase
MSEDITPHEPRASGVVTDALSRPLRSLRLSVTDRCNLRCSYCMPEPDYTWLPRSELLDFDELGALVDAFVACGTRRLRITGGEPLLRRDLPKLVASLCAKQALEDVALTTNGLMLAANADALADAGLHRLTVSLDTLRRDRFARLTKRNALDDVLAGIDAVRRTRLRRGLKIDTVALRGVNEDELAELVRFGRRFDAEVRFIEYMDVGGATTWSPDAVLTEPEILSRVSAELGPATPLPGRGSAPAQRYALPDGTTFGVIASVTEPFCRACDRSRVTADGLWLHCLYATAGVDLKTPLREGADLAPRIREAWSRRSDRGAEMRASLPGRGVLVPVDALRRNPHLEMHKRGG